jgi:hypothetical protein
MRRAPPVGLVASRGVRRMRVRRRLGRTAAVALGLMAFAPAGAWAAEAPTRYTLANGCYALQGASGQVVAGGDRVRMQATALGSYPADAVSQGGPDNARVRARRRPGGGQRPGRAHGPDARRLEQPAAQHGVRAPLPPPGAELITGFAVGARTGGRKPSLPEFGDVCRALRRGPSTRIAGARGGRSLVSPVTATPPANNGLLLRISGTGTPKSDASKSRK